MEIVFWILIILIVYPYLIYPLAMLALGLIRPRKVKRGIYLPTLTILIPAYNEVGHIGATIQNKLNQGYPHDKLQIIVISDASLDGTDDVVASFADQGVTLLRREGREGKAAALNAAVHLARGEILIFSDANSLFGPNALHRLVENFVDPEVGYVTGSLSFLMDNDHLSGDGVNAYMRYENMVRRIEAMSGSIIGVNGGVDAIRKELYVDTPPHLITDLILPLTVIAKKYRVIFDSSATAVEAPNSEISSEFRMRIRVALRAMQGLAHMRCLLNPLNRPMESFRLISHKVLRYLGFLFMITALISNAVLAHGSEFYYALLWLQIAIYSLGFLGLLPSLPHWLKQCTTIPSYLLLSNTAFAVATFRFLRGDSMAIWRPRAG
jgi:cellulose synthase/poly-beta-1,6-N-acetylglucosamine synthase-like glycosyltransferase